MIRLSAHDTIIRLAKGLPVIAITGPRQSGKTTLARNTFPDKPHLILEDPDISPRRVGKRFTLPTDSDTVREAANFSRSARKTVGKKGVAHPTGCGFARY